MPPATQFREFTTLRVGGPMGDLRIVESRDEAIDVVRDCDERGEALLVLGGGSNLLVCDDGFDGTVLALRSRGVEVVDDGEHVLVTVAAGESWDELVQRAVDEGWSGLEAMSGIPGLVGASPIQNVGAYGQEVASVVQSVEVLDRATGDVVTLAREACHFGYRSSRFKRSLGEFVVVAMTLRLLRSNVSQPLTYNELTRSLGVDDDATAPIRQVREAVLSLRRSKGMVLDPVDHDTWSAGSFFINPVVTNDVLTRLPAAAPRWVITDDSSKVSAAWLIENSGFGRGAGGELTGGRVKVSAKHALAITNRGGATGADVLALAQAIRAAVAKAFGINLVPEPTLVGCHL